MFVQKLAAAGNLGSCLPRDGKLRRGQRFPPFLKRFVNLALPGILPVRLPLSSNCTISTVAFASPGSSSCSRLNWLRDPVPRTHPQSPAPQRRKSVRDESDHSSKKLQRRPAFGYFPLIAGAGKSGGRFGSPRAPRTSSSSNSSDGATTEVGRPFCADPKAPSAVPANPATCVCM